MTHPAIDAYLDELLDLTVDAVAPVPAAASVLLSAVPSTVPAVEAVTAGVEAMPAGVTAVDIPAGLLAELEADPLLTGLMHTAPGNATAIEPAPPAAIPAGLLDELDSDPLFAGQAPAPSQAPAVPFDLLAELDDDPLFAGQAPAAATNAIPAGLLEELESDPLLAAQIAPAPRIDAAQAEAQPSRVTPAPSVESPARTGLRPVEVTPPALRPSVTTTHRWLRVAVGEDSYAVELLRVQEVGRTVPIVAMRGAAPSVLGAMNLRGRIVPVFDLGLWLGTERVTPDERARIVVVERDNELIGALVSAVDDVVTLGPDRIEPPLMASPSRAIVGVARVVAKPTVLLDANALFG
jgi:purine-binding chemotaxis protein CheW